MRSPRFRIVVLSFLAVCAAVTLFVACGDDDDDGGGGKPPAAVVTLAGGAPVANPDYDDSDVQSPREIGQPGYVDGTGNVARFRNPEGVCTDGVSLYVADAGNNVIRKVVIATGEVSTIAGGGPDGADFVDGVGEDARFNRPVGIATDGTNLYVGDRYNHAVRKVVIATGAVTTIAGALPEADDPSDPATRYHGTPGSDDGIGPAARFAFPTGILFDGTNLYVADAGNQTFRKVLLATSEVQTYAGAAGVQGDADGDRLADARFRSPQGAALIGGSLYSVEADNHLVRMITTATGVVERFAGAPPVTDNTGGDFICGADRLDCRFSYPHAIATDGVDLYVADTNSAIRKVDMAAGTGATIGGAYPRANPLFNFDPSDPDYDSEWWARKNVGTPGFVDSPVASEARFNEPHGLCVYGGIVYVSDTTNHAIRKVLVP